MLKLLSLFLKIIGFVGYFICMYGIWFSFINLKENLFRRFYHQRNTKEILLSLTTSLLFIALLGLSIFIFGLDSYVENKSYEWKEVENIPVEELSQIQGSAYRSEGKYVFLLENGNPYEVNFSDIKNTTRGHEIKLTKYIKIIHAEQWLLDISGISLKEPKYKYDLILNKKEN